MSATITWSDLEAPFTYGPVNPLEDQPRYSTLARLKRRLGIDAADTDDDADLESALVSAEIQIDQTMNRSLPDTGSNPQISGVPFPIVDLATKTAIRVWKAQEAPFGSAGGDDLLGTITIAADLEQAFREDPLLRGFVVGWGVA